ncbi:MAG: hypothetical protein HUJ65_07755, partial [Oscillospiraceae bacterium]|nr:hypothetical protein [Oscillospiraceae bacterium]
MKKRLLILILILCFALSLSSCGEKETPSESEKDQEELLNELYGDNRVEAVAAQKRDNVFTISYVPTRSMNPITGSCAENSMLEGLIYESLFVLDEHFDPQNMLCSSYSTEDGLTYRFEIVPGVKFSDGTPLTASDVMYSIDYAREFERYEYRLSNIESTTVEDGVFIVTLGEADMSLPSLLDVPVIPQGSIDSDRPIGSGLYMLAETETSARLVKNPYYRDPSKIPLDTVYLTSFS